MSQQNTKKQPDLVQEGLSSLEKSLLRLKETQQLSRPRNQEFGSAAAGFFRSSFGGMRRAEYY